MQPQDLARGGYAYGDNKLGHSVDKAPKVCALGAFRFFLPG